MKIDTRQFFSIVVLIPIGIIGLPADIYKWISFSRIGWVLLFQTPTYLGDLNSMPI